MMMITMCSPTAPVVGRILKVHAAPIGSPWMWTLAFGHHEDRTPTHGYAATHAARAAPAPLSREAGAAPRARKDGISQGADKGDHDARAVYVARILGSEKHSRLRNLARLRGPLQRYRLHLLLTHLLVLHRLLIHGR